MGTPDALRMTVTPTFPPSMVSGVVIPKADGPKLVSPTAVRAMAAPARLGANWIVSALPSCVAAAIAARRLPGPLSAVGETVEVVGCIRFSSGSPRGRDRAARPGFAANRVGGQPGR